MEFRPIHGLRGAIAIVSLATLSACGLPQLGPSKTQILSGSVEEDGNAFIINVDDQVNKAIAVKPALGFPRSFTSAARLTSDTIRPGDTLGLTIWENVDDGLLTSDIQSATTLEEVQVDSAGYVFVPYAGRVRAAGNTPDELRQLITSELEEQTPDPQVQVRRIAGEGATVSVIGSVSGQGVYTIERSTRTLSSMLARAGGVATEPEIALVTVIRGTQRGKIWFEDLFKYPKLDIALRSGDRILVEEDTRSYTAMGATASQARIPFSSQDLSAVEALAQVGGLVTSTSDAKGIFVLRNESQGVARKVTGRNDLNGSQRVVYILNLTEPNGLFLARDFNIRDGDTVYVTEAPYAKWTKTLSVLVGPLTPIASARSLATN